MSLRSALPAPRTISLLALLGLLVAAVGLGQPATAGQPAASPFLVPASAPLSPGRTPMLGGNPGTCIQTCTVTFNDCVACGYSVYACQPVYDECFGFCMRTGYPLDYLCFDHL
jgi:hypothetical protein